MAYQTKMNLFRLLFVLISMAITSKAYATPTELSKVANSMAPGTWATVNTIGMFAALQDTVADPNPGNGHIEIYAEGFKWDPFTRKAHFYGSDDGGNGLRHVIFNEATNTWSNAVVSGGPFGDPSHGYDLTAIDIKGRRLFRAGVNNFPLYSWNLDTGTIGQGFTTMPAPSGVCSNGNNGPESHEVMPNFGPSGSLIHVQYGCVNRLNLSTNTWSTLADLGLGATDYHSWSQYNPKRDILLFGYGTNMWKVDNNGLVTALPGVPTSIAVENSEVTYDPVTGIFHVFKWNFVWYTYEVNTNTWTAQSTAGVPAGFWNGQSNPANFSSLAFPIVNYGVVGFSHCNDPGGGQTCTLYLYKHAQQRMIDLMPTKADETSWYDSQIPPQIHTALDEDTAFWDDSVSYSVNTPDLHGDTEGDDLWAYTALWYRSGQTTLIRYRDRMLAWSAYFKNIYFVIVNCGTETFRYCWDRDAGQALGDHTYGTGLYLYYQLTGDTVARDTATAIATDAFNRWGVAGDNGGRVCYFGCRKWGRILQLIAAACENVGGVWCTRLNTLLNTYVNAPDFDPITGLYYWGYQPTIDGIVGGNGAGYKVMSAQELAVLMEGLFQGFRLTGRNDVAVRVEAVANYINTYALKPTGANAEYTSAFIGFDAGGVPYYTGNGCDPSYTTGFTNSVYFSYYVSGNTTFRDRAKYFWNRGTKATFDNCPARNSPDNEVDHYIDTDVDSPSCGFYLDHNKGEWQKTYMMFFQGGTGAATAPDTEPPAPNPANLAGNPSGTTINLTWTGSTDNSGSVSYRIERCLGLGCNTFVDIASSSLTSYSDINLNPSTRYRYKVRAVDPSLNYSGYSNIIDVDTGSAPVTLVLAYALSTGVGTVAIDSSTYLNNGTLNGGSAWTTGGQYGNAINFDGVDDFISTPDVGSLDIGGIGTIMAWVKLDTLNRWHGVIAKGNANDNNAHNYAIEITSGNKLNCVIGTGTSNIEVISTASMVTGAFFHAACVWNGSQVILYLNGTQAATPVTQSLTPAGNASTLWIGQFGGNADRLDGVIDEVRIYNNKSLTQVEIQSDMNTPIGVPPAPAPLPPANLRLAGAEDE